MRRFTPADIARLRELASWGHCGKAIARDLGRTPQAVRVKCCELGIKLRPVNVDCRRIKIPPDTWRGLQDEAARLGTSPGRLGRLLLVTIIRDRLVDAIVDAPPARVRATATRRDPTWREALGREGVAA